jgi:hypothetical protein
MRLYEQLIDDGIADADRRDSAVDHLTARRLAIWLNARPQERDFAEGLNPVHPHRGGQPPAAEPTPHASTVGELLGSPRVSWRP